MKVPDIQTPFPPPDIAARAPRQAAAAQSLAVEALAALFVPPAGAATLSVQDILGKMLDAVRQRALAAENMIASLPPDLGGTVRTIISVHAIAPGNVTPAGLTEQAKATADALETLVSGGTLPAFRELSASSREAIRELAALVRETPAAVTEKANEFSGVFSVRFPVGNALYPCVIHVYRHVDDTGPDGGHRPESREEAAETWLRILLDTDNLGVTDVIIHLSGRNRLSVRLNLAGAETAEIPLPGDLSAELSGILRAMPEFSGKDASVSVKATREDTPRG